jgi:hypothetical protein
MPLRPRRQLPSPRAWFAALFLAAGCGGNGPSDPSVPSDIAIAPATVSFTAIGETEQLTASVTDQRGDPVTNATVTWSSSNAEVASVSPTGLVTAVGSGSTEISASSGELDATAEISVIQSVATFEPVSGNAQPGVVGTALALPLIVRALDSGGNPIAGLQVQFNVAQGGGSVQPASATTQPDGTASCVFTLGNTPGAPQQVTATAAGTATTASFTATATETPARVTPFSGNGQSAPAGGPVPVAPAARVVDGDGNPVPGVAVAFAVTRGGGSLTGAAQAISGFNGVATTGGWVLGGSGVNTLTASLPGQILAGEPALFVATVAPTAGFDISIQYLGEPSSGQLLAFAEAEIRWESLIVGDLQNVSVNAAAGTCGTGSPALSRVVDDLVIFASLVPIDGEGGVLGAAGPCFVRLPGNLPVVGAMRFDTDDLELFEQGGLLPPVILHEMGHVLGIIGGIWDAQGFLADPSLSGGTDPHFTGPLAVAAFNTAGGQGYPGAKVPVENTGGPGTADTHWREIVLGNELMTGFVSAASNPLSAITLNSLDDQGYTVNLSGADAFSLSSASIMASSQPGISLGDDLLRVPVYRVDPGGRVVDTIWPR